MTEDDGLVVEKKTAMMKYEVKSWIIQRQNGEYDGGWVGEKDECILRDPSAPHHHHHRQYHHSHHNSTSIHNFA